MAYASAASESQELAATPRVEAAGASHVGCVRGRNDNSFAALPELGLFAVADGMGGKPGGDVASRMAVDALRETIEQDDPDETWPHALERGRAREEAALLQAFRRTNAAIFTRAVVATATRTLLPTSGR